MPLTLLRHPKQVAGQDVRPVAVLGAVPAGSSGTATVSTPSSARQAPSGARQGQQLLDRRQCPDVSGPCHTRRIRCAVASWRESGAHLFRIHGGQQGEGSRGGGLRESNRIVCTSTIVLGVWFGRWAAGWRDEAGGGRVMEWSVDCVWVGVLPFSVAQWGQVHGWSLAGSRPPTAQPRQARARVETGSSSLFPIHWSPSFVSIPPRGEETKARTPLIIEPRWLLRARSD